MPDDDILDEIIDSLPDEEVEETDMSGPSEDDGQGR